MASSEESFKERVYWIVSQIPSGKVATYGQIATYAGRPRAARAVGNLLRDSLSNGARVPWQRVINASGGISSKGDLARAELQRRLLSDEGAIVSRRGHCSLREFRWQPQDPFWEEDPGDG
jgi:methylated-DNA-protein-cysteine methyltransferase-like protein